MNMELTEKELEIIGERLMTRIANNGLYSAAVTLTQERAKEFWESTQRQHGVWEIRDIIREEINKDRRKLVSEVAELVAKDIDVDELKLVLSRKLLDMVEELNDD